MKWSIKHQSNRIVVHRHMHTSAHTRAHTQWWLTQFLPHKRFSAQGILSPFMHWDLIWHKNIIVVWISRTDLPPVRADWLQNRLILPNLAVTAPTSVISGVLEYHDQLSEIKTLRIYCITQIPLFCHQYKVTEKICWWLHRWTTKINAVPFRADLNDRNSTCY